MADRPLGNLFVRVTADVSRFTRGMSDVDKTTNRLRTQLTRFASSPALAATALAGMGAVALRTANELGKLGASAAESQNKFSRTFGASEASMAAFIATMRDVAAVSTSTAQDLTASTGLIVKGMGATEREAANVSKAVFRLAADWASFANVPTEQVLQATNAALVGERERLKTLGIVVRQAEVDARALAMAQEDGRVVASELDRIYASLAIVSQRMADSNNDAANTMNSVAREMARADAAAAQFMETLGTTSSGLTGGFARLKREVFEFGSNLLHAFNLTDDETVGGLIERMRFLQDTGRQNTKAWDETLNKLREVNQESRLMAMQQQALAEAEQQLADIAFRESLPDLTPVIFDVDLLTAAYGAQAAEMERTAFATDFLANAETELLATVGATTGAIALQEAAMMRLEQTAQSTAGTLSGFLGRLGGLGGILGTIGGLAGFLGPIGVAGSFLSKFAGIGSGFAGFFQHGGHIPAGQVGVVGERGPELVSGPADVTPMGAGGVTIVLQTESGRHLVDVIETKQQRDRDVRRIVRVPVAAVATG